MRKLGIVGTKIAMSGSCKKMFRKMKKRIWLRALNIAMVITIGVMLFGPAQVGIGTLSFNIGAGVAHATSTGPNYPSSFVTIGTAPADADWINPIGTSKLLWRWRPKK